MADETTTTNGEASPERQAQVKELIDKTAAQVLRSPLQAQRENGFRAMAKQEGAMVPCSRCQQPTTMHVNGVCRECFVGGADARPAARAQCGFCGRQQALSAEDKDGMKFLQPGESIIRGNAGSSICSTCAAGAAGCQGAKNAAEARSMMAAAATQAAAAAVCNRCAGIVDALLVETAKGRNLVDGQDAKTPAEAIEESQRRADLVLTLGEAAEMFARIARGGQ